MPVAPHPLVTAAFNALEGAGVRWALLRGGDRLAEPEGDVDLVVHPSDGRLTRAAMHDAGFAERRVWAGGTQMFFVGWHPASARWIDVHVMARIAFGAPAYGLELSCAAEVVDRRQGAPPGPRSDDAFWITLLHALLDKGEVAAKHREELRQLMPVGATGAVAEALDRLGLEQACDLLESWTAGDLDELARRGRHLRDAWAARSTARARARRNGRSLVARKLDEALRPTVPSIALLAPDGAGKSTLADALMDAFHVPAQRYYLGLEGGPMADEPRSRVPGLGLIRRLAHVWTTWLRARIARARRQVVVFDRYPLDALLEPRAPVGWAARLRRGVLGRSLPSPEVVVVLDAPAEVLHARKPEHGVDVLRADRQRYRDLAERLPTAVVIDASGDPDAVRRDVVAAAFAWMRARKRP